MGKAFKAILAYFAFKILVWSGGKEIIATAVNEIVSKNKPDPEPKKEVPQTLTMMQNQHLAGILLAMGCPPKEAEIRSEIFGFKDMPMIRDKLYFFKSAYWVDC